MRKKPSDLNKQEEANLLEMLAQESGKIADKITEGDNAPDYLKKIFRITLLNTYLFALEKVGIFDPENDDLEKYSSELNDSLQSELNKILDPIKEIQIIELQEFTV